MTTEEALTAAVEPDGAVKPSVIQETCPAQYANTDQAYLCKNTAPLTPRQLIERGIAPVKADYVLTNTRKVLQEAVAGTAVNVRPQQKVSRNQQRKARKAARANNLCFNFQRGTCTFGSTCKFSHDTEVYFANREPDLPGKCPYVHQSRCPHGIGCRWATTHPASQQVLEGQPQLPAHLQGADAVNGVGDHFVIAPPVGPRYTGDGSIPAATVELPIPASIQPESNFLPAPVLTALRHCTYDFEPAHAVLTELGAPHKPYGKARKAAKVSGSAQAAPTPVAPEIAHVTAGAAGSTAGQVGAQPQRQQQEDAGVHQDQLEEGTKVHALTENVQVTADSCDVEQQAKRLRLDSSQLPDVALQELQQDAPAAAQPATAQVAAMAGAAARMGEDAGGALERARVNDAYTSIDVSTVGPDSAAADAVPLKTVEASTAVSPAINQDAAEMLLYDVTAQRAAYTEERMGGREKQARKAKFQSAIKGLSYLAPLTTVGNLPFRRLCKDLGVGITCGEMALGTNLLQGQRSEWALLKRHPCEDLFGVQVCGGFPDTMARCAQLLNDVCDLSFVDLNCGCPIDCICDKGAGSSLMTRPERFKQVVQSMSRVLDCPFTVKIRKGYYDDKPLAHSIVQQVGEWGAAAVTVHGRTRQQRYTRQADWDYIQQCIGVCRDIPLIGNGDCFSFVDFEQRLQQGAATVLVARGALIKPWVFTEIQERRHWDIAATERLDLLKQFCAYGVEHWGADKQGVEATRRFFLEWLSYTCRYVPVGLLEVLPQQLHWRPPAFKGRNDLETLLASDSPQDWVRISEMLLGPAPPGFVFSPKHKSNAYATTEADLDKAFAQQGP